MEAAMRKGARNYGSVIFAAVHKLVGHTSWRSALNSMAHKLAQAGK